MIARLLQSGEEVDIAAHRLGQPEPQARSSADQCRGEPPSAGLKNLLPDRVDWCARNVDIPVPSRGMMAEFTVAEGSV